jgi:hypothetical protein
MSNAVESSSRKSLIATSMAAVVLSVDKSPGINWIVDIDGAWTWTWLFLLAAHGYFFIMYAVNGGLQQFKVESLCFFKFYISEWGEATFRAKPAHWMNRPFVTLLALG